MNPFEAVGIIILAFFIAGLTVGFLIVMALPALAHRERGEPKRGRRGQSWRGDWPGTGPPPGGPGGANGEPVGHDDDDPDGPPGIPWCGT